MGVSGVGARFSLLCVLVLVGSFGHIKVVFLVNCIVSVAVCEGYSWPGNSRTQMSDGSVSGLVADWRCWVLILESFKEGSCCEVSSYIHQFDI